MKLLTATRWSDGSKEYFMLRTDAVLSNPSVTMNWQEDGQSFSAQLHVTSVDGKSLEGYLDAQVDGDFILNGTIGSITIEDESESTSTPPTEKPIAPGGSGSFINFQYDVPAQVNRQWYLYTFSDGPGYTGLWSFSNRLADSGNSGISLVKTMANGWALPGAESPEMATEERITELLGMAYEENATWANKCYLVGSEVVFIRSNPSGTYATRRPLSTTYTIEVNASILDSGSGTPLLQQASYDHLVGYRSEDSYTSTTIEAPDVKHFQDEIDSIYELNYPEMGTDFIDGMSVYVPESTQDRAADQHFSVVGNNHNRIEGEV